MSRTPAMAVSAPDPSAMDPYRALFDQLPSGVARCRPIIDGDQVIAVEVVDSNRAFDAARDALPRLLELLSRVRETARPATVVVRGERDVLSVSGYPIGDPVEEVMVVAEDVTARDQLAQRAREWQVRFEQAFHGNAAAMVIAQRSDLRIIDVNPPWLELFETTRADVLGRTSVELGLITEAGAQARIAQHRRHIDGYDTEIELSTRRGARRTVIASAKPIQIAEGTCTLTTLIDITRRKHAEDAFAAAFSASPAGLILVDDATDTVVAVNDRLLDLVARRRGELVGQPVAELGLVASPSREVLMAQIASAGRLDGVEVELARAGGGGVWALASTERVTLQNAVHRLTVFTDLTARKQHERRLITQNAIGHQLTAAAPFDVVIAQALETLCRDERWDCGAMWMPADDGSAPHCAVRWCDPELGDRAAAVLRGLALVGGLPGRVLATGAADKLALDAAAGAWAAALVATGMRHAAAFPILRGNAVLGVVAMARRGGDTVLDAAERGLFDSIGRLLGLFLERSRAEASLRELNGELERRVLERTRELENSNRDLDAFSASVSHDLRAPLRAITGFSDILLADFAPELPDEARHLLTRIRASGDRLHKLVEDLLAFSRFGRAEPQRVRVELEPMVRSVVDDLVAGRGLGDRVDLQLSPLGECHADPSLLRTVWSNLIDNALKYSQNRERIVLEIGCQQRAGETVYSIVDNGVGFDMAFADRLFGVFQRLHTATEFDGTGIGLANVRRIIERHHGWVSAWSQPGRGSRFEFTLGEAAP